MYQHQNKHINKQINVNNPQPDLGEPPGGADPGHARAQDEDVGGDGLHPRLGPLPVVAVVVHIRLQVLQVYTT